MFMSMAITPAFLNNLRFELIHLHKTLIDHERANYEWRHGTVPATQFLQLLMSDPQFAWLQFLSQLIVNMDELLDSKEPASQEKMDMLVSTAKKLLNPASIDAVFAEKYQDALQKEPAVILAHQRVRQVLTS